MDDESPWLEDLFLQQYCCVASAKCNSSSRKILNAQVVVLVARPLSQLRRESSTVVVARLLPFVLCCHRGFVLENLCALARRRPDTDDILSRYNT